MPIDAEHLGAVAAFTRRFAAFPDLTNPLLAIVEAAQLKGRIEVLEQFGALDPKKATEGRQLIDLVLAALLDKYLDERYDISPVRGLMASLGEHVKGLNHA